AAGGIRTGEQALNFLEAGADRLGTSSGTKIIEELKQLLTR
ncbi:MAG: 2-deoxyribose-5-phosphate aldolase, partial [Thaumarchaeota archaeon]|nr:2-deoxyribose-5-phosphate aldolase [Nitrososphaerota archaeon]